MGKEADLCYKNMESYPVPYLLLIYKLMLNEAF
jgi:hypothetical protein